MKFTSFNQTYNCTSIARTVQDSLTAVHITEDGDSDTITFDGIRDMTQFQITNDDGTETTAADLPVPVSDAQRLQAMEAAILAMAGEIYG